MKRLSTLLQVGIAYAGFTAMGLTAGLLGVAWPSIRSAFGLPLDAMGTLLLAATVGSILSSFNGGLVASAIGFGPLLMVSTVVQGVGLLGYGAAPAWWIMVLAGALAGMGAGALHAGLNVYFAANHGAGAMNWLHACFGLGATLGPLMMTATLNVGLSWRWGYGIAAASLGSLAVGFALTLSRWQGFEEKATEASGHIVSNRSGLEALKLPVVWLILALFFIYTGVESTASQWAYSLFTEARSVAAEIAGFWTSVYWGGLTVGRLLLGGVADRLRVTSLLRLSILGVLGGAALVWWHPSDPLSFLGLALMGFAEAPIFPSLVSHTPKRIGPQHAANAIGFQIAAATLGAAALSGLAGILAQNVSLEIIGPFLVVGALAMFVLQELTAPRG